MAQENIDTTLTSNGAEESVIALESLGWTFLVIILLYAAFSYLASRKSFTGDVSKWQGKGPNDPNLSL